VLLKRNLNLKGYIGSLQQALKTACTVFMLVAGSIIMGHFLAVTTIPMATAEWVEWVGNLPVNRYLIIVIYNIGVSSLIALIADESAIRLARNRRDKLLLDKSLQTL